MTEELMDGKTSQETEDFKYFDPKLLKPGGSAPSRAMYQEAIVFVVGGGNYMEYQNLMDSCKVNQYIQHWSSGKIPPPPFYASTTDFYFKRFIFLIL